MSTKLLFPAGLLFALACEQTKPPGAADGAESAPGSAAEAVAPRPDNGQKTDVGKVEVSADKSDPEGLEATINAAMEKARQQAATAPEPEPVISRPAGGAVDPRWPPGSPIVEVGSVSLPGTAVMDIYALKVKKYSDRGREVPESAARRYRKSLAERVAYQELLRQEASRRGVTHDKVALAEREAQQRRGITDWAKHLARRGETEASLRAMYIAELTEAAILEDEGKLAVSRREVETDYEAIKGNWSASKPRARAAHILIPIDGSEADAKRAAEEAYAEAIKPGADFGAIAKKRSTGPSANKGGDIGIFTPDRMAEEFSDAVFAATKGAILKPVKTKFGYHVIKVTGRWPAGDLPMSALEDQILDRLRQRKLHQGRRELKEQLWRDPGATTWLDYDTGARRSKPVAVGL